MVMALRISRWAPQMAFAIVIANVVGFSAGAQAPDARAALITVTVAPDTVTIGELFTVRVRVRAPKVATVTFPDVPARNGTVDPIDPRTVEEGPPSDLLDRTAVYSFVAWDVGARGPTLGPVVVSVAGQERSFNVGAASVIVRSLLPADTTERTPKDLRAPLPLPGKLWQYLVVGGALLFLLTWLWWRRRARKRLGPVDEAPEAWVLARETFKALDTLALADAGEPGRHVIAHVDVVRDYVSRRFPDLKASLDGATFMAVLATLDFPIPAPRIGALIDRDAALRFAQADITPDDAAALVAEARDVVGQLQLAHEARMRAVERPPRPKRR